MNKKSYLPVGRQPHNPIRRSRVATYEQLAEYFTLDYKKFKERVDLYEETGHELNMKSALSVMSFGIWYEKNYGT